MLLRFENGREQHCSIEVGVVLVAGGLATEIIKPKPEVDRTPRWEVGIIGTEYPRLAVVMRIANAVYCYSDDPKHLNARKDWDGGGRYLSGFGRPVPDELVATYKRAWKDSPALRGTQAGLDEYCEQKRQEQLERLIKLGIVDRPKFKNGVRIVEV